MSWPASTIFDSCADKVCALGTIVAAGLPPVVIVNGGSLEARSTPSTMRSESEISPVVDVNFKWPSLTIAVTPVSKVRELMASAMPECDQSTTFAAVIDTLPSGPDNTNDHSRGVRSALMRRNMPSLSVATKVSSWVAAVDNVAMKLSTISNRLCDPASV